MGKVTCPFCHAHKKIRGMGMVLKDCLECDSKGFYESIRDPEDHIMVDPFDIDDYISPSFSNHNKVKRSPGRPRRNEK